MLMVRSLYISDVKMTTLTSKETVMDEKYHQ